MNMANELNDHLLAGYTVIVESCINNQLFEYVFELLDGNDNKVTIDGRKYLVVFGTTDDSYCDTKITFYNLNNYEEVEIS